jgi:hypothetical protein
MVPWGYKIPGSLFLHFVLPYRVNNENIENCRGILFKELYSRVRNLSMTDAILEVNHWCHEKVTYIACDPRTSSPLTAIRRALGRCGEESTLAVSALRSLCIPARQCYTPRWAHCDDNHAWVEAWADGKWSYLGACEPDARLNNGWFRDPARRAMLVNTRVLGNYTGPEEITLSHEWYTELNLLDNYAPVKKITVKVTNREGNPIPGATIYFQVFNSGEFSTIARLTSDNNGKASLTTGYGDLMVHAAGGNGWGNKKISVTKGDYFEIPISGEPPVCGTQEIDMAEITPVCIEYSLGIIFFRIRDKFIYVFLCSIYIVDQSIPAMHSGTDILCKSGFCNKLYTILRSVWAVIPVQYDDILRNILNDLRMP